VRKFIGLDGAAGFDIRQNQPGPAKHAAFKPVGNDLLTIPTYLHFSGKVATRAKRAAAVHVAIGVIHGSQGEAGGG
jgi:hypothetical protein